MCSAFYRLVVFVLCFEGRVKEEDLSIINMKVEAVLNQFSVGICNSVQLITEVQIKGNHCYGRGRLGEEYDCLHTAEPPLLLLFYTAPFCLCVLNPETAPNVPLLVLLLELMLQDERSSSVSETSFSLFLSDVTSLLLFRMFVY